MHEASKTREAFAPYLQGRGLDIGAGPDPLTPDCLAWDLPQGDAQEMRGLAPESFDWVFSAHCLEHLRNPTAALARWWSLVKPGGFLLLAVPDADGYEQGFWPSRWNPTHLWAFTASTDASWCPANLNLAELVGVLPRHRLLRLETVVDERPAEPEDITLRGCKAQVEMVVQKLTTPLELRSSLPELFACPICKAASLCVGRTSEGSLRMRCSRCGQQGDI